MENESEKFFEELASKMAGEDAPSQEVKIELTKASATAEKPKIIVQEQTKEDLLRNEPEGELTVDVYQTPAEIVVESAVAGVEPENLDISVTPESITIKGHRMRERRVRDEDYFCQECYWGRFTRSIILPQEVDPEKVQATFKNGILTVRLPKLNRQKTKKVKVKLE